MATAFLAIGILMLYALAVAAIARFVSIGKSHDLD